MVHRMKSESRVIAFFLSLALILAFLPFQALAENGSTETLGDSGAAPVSISTGSMYSIAVDEVGQVWSWGYNWYGALGIGNQTNKMTPQKVQFQGVNGLEDFDQVVKVDTFYNHCVALRSDGTVWVWGNNESGQLGFPKATANRSLVAVQVEELEDIVDVAAGAQHTLALNSDGEVWAWGKNTNGQLGDGSTTDSVEPVESGSLEGVVAVSAGEYDSYALDENGVIWSWGHNSWGQLGVNSRTVKTSPVQVQGISDVVAVDGGANYSVALKSDGTVWTSGSAATGKLGDGSTDNSESRSTYAQITGFGDVESISVGYGHVFAIKGDQTLWAWGWNNNGQVGDGTTVNVSTPTMILEDVTVASAGTTNSLALRRDAIWSWGVNTYGQLGDGTNLSSLVPKSRGYLEPVGFYHTSDVKIMNPDGIETLLASIDVDNSVWHDPYFWYKDLGYGEWLDVIRDKHMNAGNYKEIADMGFNSIRFDMRLSTYFKDEVAYLNWMDENIRLAAANNIGVLIDLHWMDSDYNKAIWREWDDAENRQALIVQFWTEIAAYYEDNPNIIGYGILNEPLIQCVPSGNTANDQLEAYNMWGEFAQELVDVIRDEDENHIIFVEPLGGMDIMELDNQTLKYKSTGINYEIKPETYNFYSVNDRCNNVVYEQHMYHPSAFALAGPSKMATIDPIYVYPNDNLAFVWQPGTSYNFASSESASNIANSKYPLFRNNYNPSMLDDWTYVESDPFTPITPTENAEILSIGVSAYRLNTGSGSGTAYFDDFEVYLYDPQTQERQLIHEADLDNTAEKAWWCTGATNTIQAGGPSNAGKNVVMTNASAGASVVSYGTAKSPIYLPVREGYQYIVSAKVKMTWPTGVTPDPFARAYPILRYYRDPNSATFNKEGLRKYVKAYQNFVEGELNAPLYIGEFGTNAATFDTNLIDLNADGYIGDFIDVCFEEDVHFDYFCYFSGTHGMYQDMKNNDPNTRTGIGPTNPSDRNESLYTVLVEKIHNRFIFELESISVTTQPTKTTYTVGETLSLSGMGVTATYSNGSSGVVTGCTTSPASGTTLSTPGSQTVTVSYTKNGETKTTSFNVTVNAASAALSSIAVTTQPTETTYTAGETLDLTGMVITATYSDSSTGAVAGYSTNPANGATLSTPGSQAVTVSYTENGVTKTTSFNVTVNSASGSILPTGISLDCEYTAIRPYDNFTLTATVSPNNATDQTVTWYSSNDEWVTVDEYGYVESIEDIVYLTDEPYVTITAETVNGLTATCTVEIQHIR